MIENLSRSGLARRTTWTVHDHRVTTPNMVFLRSESIKAPEGAEIVALAGNGLRWTLPDGESTLFEFPERFYAPPAFEDSEREEDACHSIQDETEKGNEGRAHEGGKELVILEGAFELRRDARSFVSQVTALRQQVGPRPLIFAPGMADVSNLALLAYAGVDLVDSSLLTYQGLRGHLSTPEGWLPADKAAWLVSSASPDEQVAFNLSSAWKELQLIKHMIEAGRLRELVEIRSNASPWNVAALRLLDLQCYDLQERFAAVVGSRFYANSKQSLNRPDVVRYRKRICERFRPAPHKKVLLLLPCSAKKPYFTSKSHRAFRSVLTNVANHSVVQELIVTSPLGVVPRELELFYPAAQYDIPVTGHWDLEEKKMVQELVRHVSSFGFEQIISHLGPESEFVREVVDCTETSDGRPTSSTSLAALESALRQACEPYENVSGGAERAASLASAARCQFGEGGERLLEGCSVSGNYPYSRIMSQGVQMGMLTQERGMISLTLDGGERLQLIGKHWVEMEDFDLKGNLFCKGVRSVDPGIRAGDEALVLRKGQLEAVGVAAVCADDMLASERGQAVAVRHKRKS